MTVDCTRFPLFIEFAPRTTIHREQDRVSQLPIFGNGPPGTFVVFPDGLRVSLPTDQIVSADDRGGAAQAAFGGMCFVGVEDGMLAFRRVRELRPEQELSPYRSHRMVLDPHWVAQVFSDGQQVWPPHE